jgi:hypothetical protein
MKLLDINGREIEVGCQIAWIRHQVKWTGLGKDFHRERTTEIKTGTCWKLLFRLSRPWKKDQERILKYNIGIEGHAAKYAYCNHVTCYNSKRVGVLTGDINEDSQTLEKLSRLDDKEPQAQS